MSARLSIRNLEVRRGGVTVLGVAELDVFDGEVLAIIGPNGAGKSTLLHALAALERPARGRVLFEGEPVAGRELSVRRRMAVVLQEPLLLDASVRENVETGLRLRGVPRHDRHARAQRWLERFGVGHLAGRSARKLSGGEARRVSLARAFVLDPDVLLLDEPFSALDQPTRETLLEELADVIRETRMTAVFVTHDRAEAARLASRVAVLLAGRLRQIGSIGEVFGAPADEEVAAFVGIETMAEGRVIEAVDGVVALDVSGRRVEAAGVAPASPSALVCVRPEDVVLGRADDGAHVSARNRLPGVVVQVTSLGHEARVVVDCGFHLVARVTRLSAEELGLEAGTPVVASFKATSVHLIPR